MDKEEIEVSKLSDDSKIIDYPMNDSMLNNILKTKKSQIPLHMFLSDPGFSPNPQLTYSEKDSKAQELFESGVRAKEYKNILKREEKKKNKKPNITITHNKKLVFE